MSTLRPTIWCFPATLNTIILAIFQRCVKVNYDREILKTQDGGVIAIDWANIEESNKKLILIIFPGNNFKYQHVCVKKLPKKI